jgi:GNAT superfamily N-acetyltransferase
MIRARLDDESSKNHERAMAGIDFERVRLPNPDAERLIALLNQELTERYPEEGANHFRLDPEEVEPGRGAFLLARLADEPIACGAVRLLDTSTAEIKRMFTLKDLRGQGVAQALLSKLEGAAIELGATRMVLETGERQLEAIRLYEQFGYAPIPAFGEYADSPLSVCMAKDLARADR